MRSFESCKVVAFFRGKGAGGGGVSVQGMGSFCNSQGRSVPICPIHILSFLNVSVLLFIKLIPSSKHADSTVPSSKYLPALSVMFILAEILYTQVLDPPSSSFLYSCYVFEVAIRLE